MLRNGRRSARLRRRSAARRRRCAGGCGRRSGTGACAPALTSDEQARIKALERENRELRQANEISAQGVGVFCDGGARPPVQAMIAFIDDHREVYGVEPICRALPIAPSTYHEHVARRFGPARLPPQAKRDTKLVREIRRVWQENFRVYGVCKVWRQLRPGGIGVARYTGGEADGAMGLAGAVHGKVVKTPVRDPAARCPRDKVNRRFRAARTNALWVSDFTYVATRQGFVYVALVIDVLARRIVGWWVSRSAQAGFLGRPEDLPVLVRGF